MFLQQICSGDIGEMMTSLIRKLFLKKLLSRKHVKESEEVVIF
jgi:hypothetical protein